ncbi:spore gernimation protein GerPD [Chengkuizengella sp. SCS-71B]|uniref:spore gernimation protein GerPD n=1 Tax=Chengkuizengella sp. SCS-71B TaxID=3115290 RepID=UPI0032C20DC8
MNFTVVNKDIHVGDINIIGLTGSSVLLVGDTEHITSGSAFDTPPEALIIGPLAPLAPETPF